MCTVIIDVPGGAGGHVRVLAIRDEDPARPWRGPGQWWPDRYPGVTGIGDQRAGGAWLAVNSAARRAAVVLNRRERVTPEQPLTRGVLPLESAVGRPLPDVLTTRGFNLVEIAGASVRVTSWDGVDRRDVVLEPGTHMIAHDDVDSELSARIGYWLPDFRAAARSSTDADWTVRWTNLLARTAEEPPDADHAIIRKQWFQDAPSHSLLMCLLDVGPDRVHLEYAPFEKPGTWSDSIPALLRQAGQELADIEAQSEGRGPMDSTLPSGAPPA